MIRQLVIDKHEGVFAYAKKIPFLSKKKVKFKKGLNILVGSNGSGKSTILLMIARYLAATQGGFSVVTEGWIRDNYNMFDHKHVLHHSIEHDGQPILYGNPRNMVGLSGGAFDDDFFESGLRNIMTRASTGQTTMGRLNYPFSVLAGRTEFPKEVEYRIHKDQVNEVWAKSIEALEANFVAKLEKSQPTVLLDEPESGLSLEMQARLWTKLLGVKLVAANFQIIVASHSPFAIGHKHANYIEMEAGYLESSLISIKEWTEILG